MNRIATFSATAARPHPIRASIPKVVAQEEPQWLDELRLFATGWLAGLVFFGTLLA